MSGAERINKKRSLGEQLRDARYATLDSRAVSDNANKLVDCLTDEIIKWEIRYGRRRRGRRSGAEKLRADARQRPWEARGLAGVRVR
jgi:hypothetical protein